MIFRGRGATLGTRPQLKGSGPTGEFYAFATHDVGLFSKI